MSETVTADVVRRVAELALLELKDDEVTRMQKDLNAILGHIDQLNELDTTGVPPMAQVSEILGGQVEASADALREDLVRPSIDRTAVLREAPEADHRFFKVPKVIER